MPGWSTARFAVGVGRFECLIEKEAKFARRVDGGPMVVRKTRVRRSMFGSLG